MITLATELRFDAPAPQPHTSSTGPAADYCMPQLPTGLTSAATSAEAEPSRPAAIPALKVQPLVAGQEREALAFLGVRAIHTVAMASLISDNGLESPFNRGVFYGCRDAAGQLLGVALFGHVVLLETRTDAALAALALQTHACPRAHLIMGEEARVEHFWQYFAQAGQSAHYLRYELLFEQRERVAGHASVPELRRATQADLDAVLLAHAALASSENGINPLEVDPEGFRTRTMRRIEQGRVWVWIKAGRLIFKADVAAETPEVSYLEGVYVNPTERGKGYGLRCLTQLCSDLLRRTNVVCLLVNEQNVRAQEVYRRAGFQLHSRYSTIFLRPAA